MNHSRPWRAASSAVVLGSLLTAANTVAAERKPAILVTVRAAAGDAGATESADDVRAALQGLGRDALLAPAPVGDTTEIVLRVVARRTRLGPQAGGATIAGKMTYSVSGAVEDLAATDPAARTRMAEGVSVTWRDAATRLVEAASQLVEGRQHVLLRRRADWPDVGFIFDELTEERRARLGAKEGNIVVIAVKPLAAAQAAGVQEGDVVLNADGKKLKNAAELARAIYTAAAASSMKLDLSRRGERHAVVLKVP